MLVMMSVSSAVVVRSVVYTALAFVLFFYFRQLQLAIRSGTSSTSIGGNIADDRGRLRDGEDERLRKKTLVMTARQSEDHPPLLLVTGRLSSRFGPKHVDRGGGSSSAVVTVVTAVGYDYAGDDDNTAGLRRRRQQHPLATDPRPFVIFHDNAGETAAMQLRPQTAAGLPTATVLLPMAGFNSVRILRRSRGWRAAGLGPHDEHDAAIVTNLETPFLLVRAMAYYDTPFYAWIPTTYDDNRRAGTAAGQLVSTPWSVISTAARTGGGPPTAQTEVVMILTSAAVAAGADDAAAAADGGDEADDAVGLYDANAALRRKKNTTRTRSDTTATVRPPAVTIREITAPSGIIVEAAAAFAKALQQCPTMTAARSSARGIAQPHGGHDSFAAGVHHIRTPGALPAPAPGRRRQLLQQLPPPPNRPPLPSCTSV